MKINTEITNVYLNEIWTFASVTPMLHFQVKYSSSVARVGASWKSGILKRDNLRITKTCLRQSGVVAARDTPNGTSPIDQEPRHAVGLHCGANHHW